MNNKIIMRLSSKKATIVLLTIYAIIMAVATFVEKYYGTPVAKATIYYSPLFFLIQAMFIINFILLSVKKNLFTKKKYTYLTIHAAFIVILCGAGITHFTSKEGFIHIREGEKTSTVMIKSGEGHTAENLPFEIELTDFKLTRYPGSHSPSSYESFIKIYSDGKVVNEKIFMNNIIDIKGYRLFQASYDADEKGSILSVNRDVTGRTVTYIGYFMLLIGFVISVFDKNSKVRVLWKSINSGLSVMTFVILSMTATDELKSQTYNISKEHAELFGETPLQSINGRIVPVNTFASEVFRKLKLEDVLNDITPEQFLLGVMVYPADWSVVPIIEVESKTVSETFGWNTDRLSYRDLFNENGIYILSSRIEEIYVKSPETRSKIDKEILKIDDKVNILHGLLTNSLMRLYPNPIDTVNHRWLSAGEASGTILSATIDSISGKYTNSILQSIESGNWNTADESLRNIIKYQKSNNSGIYWSENRLKAEVIYNNLNLPYICQIGYFVITIAMIISFTLGDSRSFKRYISILFTLGVYLFFMIHTICLTMRWYISGYAPWSNSYEMMISLAWASVLCGIIFIRKNKIVTSLSVLFGGIVLFVSGLSWMDPQITPLVPVLKSPWLISHVATLVIAYGFMGISCMIGATSLIIGNKGNRSFIKQMTEINELSILLGSMFLTVGIFLGAIWANESWGRYWSWDPKETWALITLIIYSAVLHVRWFYSKNDKIFSIMSHLSFLSVLMTFLGVNYLLSGMHSYGSNNVLSSIPWWGYLLFISFFILPEIIARIKRLEK